jgi:hypothetical protein
VALRDPAALARMCAASKARWANPLMREKMIAAMRAAGECRRVPEEQGYRGPLEPALPSIDQFGRELSAGNRITGHDAFPHFLKGSRAEKPRQIPTC